MEKFLKGGLLDFFSSTPGNCGRGFTVVSYMQLAHILSVYQNSFSMDHYLFFCQESTLLLLAFSFRLHKCCYLQYMASSCYYYNFFIFVFVDCWTKIKSQKINIQTWMNLKMNTKLKYNILFKLSVYTPNTVLRFGVSKVVLNKYFILQVSIKLIIGDSKDMYKYKILIFQINSALWNFVFIKYS